MSMYKELYEQGIAPLRQLPEGSYVVTFGKGLNIPDTIRHKLRIRHWEFDGRGHPHLRFSGTDMRILLKPRTVHVQVLGQERDARGRRKRVTIARAFYSKVVWLKDNRFIIGGHTV